MACSQGEAPDQPSLLAVALDDSTADDLLVRLIDA